MPPSSEQQRILEAVAGGAHTLEELQGVADRRALETLAGVGYLARNRVVLSETTDRPWQPKETLDQWFLTADGRAAAGLEKEEI